MFKAGKPSSSIIFQDFRMKLVPKNKSSNIHPEKQELRNNVTPIIKYIVFLFKRHQSRWL